VQKYQRTGKGRQTNRKAVQKYKRIDKGSQVQRKSVRKGREAVAAARGQPMRYLTEAEMQALRDEHSADPQTQQALHLFKVWENCQRLGEPHHGGTVGDQQGRHAQQPGQQDVRSPPSPQGEL
jgi:hypothetical protein